MSTLEVQTRNHDGELRYFATFATALEHSKTDPEVWKISFSLPSGERVRMTRTEDDHWVYDPLLQLDSLMRMDDTAAQTNPDG